MNTWILLLRGINIGGRNILRMAHLRSTLAELGLADVRTYIQSGNVVFRSRHRSATAVRRLILDAIEAEHGLQPEAVLLRPTDVLEAIDANPFTDAMIDPGRLYVFFLTARPEAPDLYALRQLRCGAERFELAGDVLFLHAPEGLARSKLGANLEKKLGVAATARNWRTVNKLAEMAGHRGV